MAALEKIRKRAVILTIVIGAGLLAFILEEGVRASQSFFNDTTAARVGSDKIGVQEFNQRYEQMTQDNQNQQNKQDAAVEQQQLLTQMEMETLLDNECEANSIAVSDDELSMVVNNSQMGQQMTQYIAQQLGQNIQSPAQLDRMIQANPEKFQLVAGKWNEMKKQASDMLRSSVLQYMVSNAIQPNDLELSVMNAENSDTYEVSFAKKDYSTVATDKKYQPSQSEIEAVYNQYKNLWKINDPQARLHYVAVNIAPSKADLAAAQKVIDKAKAVIAGPNGVDSLKNISEFSNIQNSKITLEQAKQFAQQMGDSAFTAFVSGGAKGATHFFDKGNNHVIFKITDVAELVDTAKVVVVEVQGDKAKQNKVLAALNAGQDVSKMQGVQVAPEQPMQVQNPQLSDSVRNQIEANAATGKYFVLQSDAKNGAALLKVNSAVKKTFYSLAVSSYEVVASSQTSTSTQDKLQTFLNKNKTAAAFEKNAAKYGYAAQEAFVNSATAQLGGNPQFGMPGITNSRKAIKWALTEGKKGTVSNIFTDNNDVLVAVALDDIYDGDFLPLTDPEVLTFCTNKARALKIAKAMEAQYKGKASNVAGYAKLFGTTPDVTSVTFGNDQVMKINTTPLSLDGQEGDGGFIGRVAAAKQGKTYVWAGNSAIYDFTVTKTTKSAMKLKKEELKNRWMMQYGIISNQQMGIDRFTSVLMTSKKIKNNLVKFQ